MQTEGSIRTQLLAESEGVRDASEAPSRLPVASPRQTSSPARRKAINRTGGTWARKWAFGSDRGRTPFDQSVPESRITPKRESAVAGRGPGWPFSAHSAPGLSGRAAKMPRRGLAHDREGRHPSPRARREPRGPGEPGWQCTLGPGPASRISAPPRAPLPGGLRPQRRPGSRRCSRASSSGRHEGNVHALGGLERREARGRRLSFQGARRGARCGQPRLLRPARPAVPALAASAGHGGGPRAQRAGEVFQKPPGEFPIGKLSRAVCSRREEGGRPRELQGRLPPRPSSVPRRPAGVGRPAPASPQEPPVPPAPAASQALGPRAAAASSPPSADKSAK
ncbi:unnamed protein product [Nyctereutes procyonoides]|uniref:(raccoon dog) hypothetical protein n=1 Tax=Nyctereutes procyonoides TaxID=34880 RepID=A0A811YX13_NYCPR|nr:unnamed protein product [Nyctereutes procyonoides]